MAKRKYPTLEIRPRRLREAVDRERARIEAIEPTDPRAGGKEKMFRTLRMIERELEMAELLKASIACSWEIFDSLEESSDRPESA